MSTTKKYYKNTLLIQKIVLVRTQKTCQKKDIKFCDISHKNNSKIVDKTLKTLYNGYMFKGQGCPLLKDFGYEQVS